jgi:hypothetical protein
MTARSNDEFDPRFDPAFQRGFEGQRDGQRARDGDGRRSAPPRAESRPLEARPVTREPYASVPIGLPPEVARDEAVVTASGQADAAAHDDQPPRVNPFLIALGVVAVALVAAGSWGIQTAREPFLGGESASNIDYIGLQILQTISPISIGLGVATAIGILFVFAVNWQKRR